MNKVTTKPQQKLKSASTPPPATAAEAEELQDHRRGGALPLGRVAAIGRVVLAVPEVQVCQRGVDAAPVQRRRAGRDRGGTDSRRGLHGSGPAGARRDECRGSAEGASPWRGA